MNTTTLKDLILSMRAIFGTRNDETFRRVTDRVAFLLDALRALEGMHRKERGPDYQRVLASIFARIVCVIDIAGDTGIDLFMSAIVAKYGSFCAYCQRSPCGCPTQGPRMPPQLQSDVDSDCRQWSLHQLQTHLEELYGKNNQSRSIRDAMLRLFAEVAEILPHTLMQQTEDVRQTLPGYYEEAADALAWLIAIANMLHIDLEKAVCTVYAHGCSVCRKKPCTCTTIGLGNFGSFHSQ